MTEKRGFWRNVEVEASAIIAIGDRDLSSVSVSCSLRIVYLTSLQPPR
jgi:hypothetical protein